MTDSAEIDLNVDELFDHLVGQLNLDMEQELDWHFSVRSVEVSLLEDVAAQLQGDFDTDIQDSVEEMDVTGKTQLGRPLLTVMKRGALSAASVKRAAHRVDRIAKQYGAEFEGVDCYEVIDEDELFGWMDREDAIWRLRHMTDIGIAENSVLPWAFLISATSIESSRAISNELTAAGMSDRDDYDDPDEEGNVGMCVFVNGRNNEAELSETAEQIHSLAMRFGGALEGIQFYSRDDVANVFESQE